MEVFDVHAGKGDPDPNPIDILSVGQDESYNLRYINKFFGRVVIEDHLGQFRYVLLFLQIFLKNEAFYQ